MAELPLVRLEPDGPVVIHKPVTRRRGRPPKPKAKQPSTRDQVAQTLVELRPACTSSSSSAVEKMASAPAPIAPSPCPPPQQAANDICSTMKELASKSSNQEKMQFIGAMMDAIMRDTVEPVVKRLVREDPRTAELIEVKKELRGLENKLDENKHFDQRVLEESHKMKRHFDEALAELAPLKKRLLTEVAPPTTPDPRVDKLEKQNAALMARMSAMEARLGAIEVEGK